MQYQRVLLFACAGLGLADGVTSSPGDSATSTDDTAAVELARQPELAEIAELLRDPEAQGYSGAVQRLVHLASRYPQTPAEVRTLLVRVTSSPDRRLAHLAERALHVFESPPRDNASVSEEMLYRRAQRRELEQTRQTLAGAGAGSDAGNRLSAVHTLVHLLSTAPDLTEEVAQLLEHVRGDRSGWRRPHAGGDAGKPDSGLDFAAAALAERALDARQGRPVDPEFLRKDDLSVAPSAAEIDPAHWTMLADESPQRRLLAMEMLIELAQNDALTGEQRTWVIAAFEILAEDPDPRVAGRARFALAGFAGDEKGWANVYVSEMVNGFTAGPQPPAPDTPRPPNVGEADEHGVYVGIVQPGKGAGSKP